MNCAVSSSTSTKASNICIPIPRKLVKRTRTLPVNSKLLVLGLGYSGSRVGALAKALGIEVIATRRQPSKGANILFDSNTGQQPVMRQLQGVTHVLSCIPPNCRGQDPVLPILGDLLRDLPLRWVGYLSTTGVYGDRQGAWVDEGDDPRPEQTRSLRRLECERDWQQAKLRVPAQILRLPGIYGPGRSVLLSLRSGRARCVDKPGHRFSRIHVDDIAGAILHLIAEAEFGHRPEIVNICDDRPASIPELMQHAAKLLACPRPELQSFSTAAAGMSPMALSFWREHRQVNNALLVRTLGYQLLHPDFRSGLTDCHWREMAGRSPLQNSLAEIHFSS